MYSRQMSLWIANAERSNTQYISFEFKLSSQTKLLCGPLRFNEGMMNVVSIAAIWFKTNWLLRHSYNNHTINCWECACSMCVVFDISAASGCEWTCQNVWQMVTDLRGSHPQQRWVKKRIGTPSRNFFITLIWAVTGWSCPPASRRRGRKPETHFSMLDFAEMPIGPTKMK